MIGIFPNASSAERLIGMLLIEENDRWALKSKLYYKPAVEQLEEKTSALIEIAHVQQQLRKVA